MNWRTTNLKLRLSRLKKNDESSRVLVSAPGSNSTPDSKAFGQSFWLGLVLTAKSTLRGASAIWEFARNHVPGLPEAPHWSTGRLWLLRLGCARLLEPKQQATDWIWLVDHTVQIGQEKCLLILGIRASQLPADRPLQLADMVPIALSPTKQANKTQVAEELLKATQVAGVPTAILSDHGADLHGGIKIFQQTHPDTRELYDMKHKAACLLKHRLTADPRFAEYGQQMGQCKFQVQQTELDFLTPPSGHSKARFMNLEKFIGWGRRTLEVLDRQPVCVLQHTTRERLEQKLGWLRGYREALAEWTSWLTVIEMSQTAVRRGVTRQTHDDLEAGLPESPLPSTRQLRSDLLLFIAEQTGRLQEQERLPLMTEVLESSFGKLKSVERDQQKRGFTSLILCLGALVGTWTSETIAAALHRTPTKAVANWVRTHFIGGTHHTKCCQAYPSNRKQIPEEL